MTSCLLAYACHRPKELGLHSADAELQHLRNFFQFHFFDKAKKKNFALAN